MISYQNFWGRVLRAHGSAEQDGLRLGQRYFLHLVEVKPLLAKALCASRLDPFYATKVVEETHNWVAAHWDSTDESVPLVAE